jgi:hypothetical protein
MMAILACSMTLSPISFDMTSICYFSSVIFEDDDLSEDRKDSFRSEWQQTLTWRIHDSWQ